jgi:YfiH family protein
MVATMLDVPTVPLLRWDDATACGAAVAVTTRHGGVSPAPYDSLNLGLHVGDRSENVVTNRQRVAAAFGIPLDAAVFARQVHGTAAARVGPEHAGRGTTRQDDALDDADILVTTSSAVTLVIMVADCVPIALVDPDAGVVAAVHAGWKGTAAGAVRVAVAAMADAGGKAERVRAYLGPAVASNRYQVGDEVRDALARAVEPAPLDEGVARRDGPGHWLVDLVAANRQQLRAAGVHPDAVADSGTTTSDPALFSDRAARPCGRFGLLAQLLP